MEPAAQVLHSCCSWQQPPQRPLAWVRHQRLSKLDVKSGHPIVRPFHAACGAQAAARLLSGAGGRLNHLVPSPGCTSLSAMHWCTQRCNCMQAACSAWDTWDVILCACRSTSSSTAAAIPLCCFRCQLHRKHGGCGRSHPGWFRRALHGQAFSIIYKV
jgi:hypothetical protein